PIAVKAKWGNASPGLDEAAGENARFRNLVVWPPDAGWIRLPAWAEPWQSWEPPSRARAAPTSEGNRNRPIVGDDVLRLASDRATFCWEMQTTLRVAREDADGAKLRTFAAGIRGSERVKGSVKEKSDAELM